MGGPRLVRGRFTFVDTFDVESVGRFARLRRKYGWWYLALLEKMLRCVDAMASADSDSEDDADDSMNAGRRGG